MKSMQFINNGMLADCVRQLDEVFTSHDLLNLIAIDDAENYVRELYKRLGTDDPITSTHSDIASRLSHPPLNVLVEKVGTSRSVNSRGKPSPVAVWRKR